LVFNFFHKKVLGARKLRVQGVHAALVACETLSGARDKRTDRQTDTADAWGNSICRTSTASCGQTEIKMKKRLIRALQQWRTQHFIFGYVYPAGNLSHLLSCPFEVQCTTILGHKSLFIPPGYTSLL